MLKPALETLTQARFIYFSLKLMLGLGNKSRSLFFSLLLTCFNPCFSLLFFSSDLDFKRLGRIAALLRFKPHLLQGFNALLRPNHRLECSTNVTEVRYLVFVTPKVARIISPTQWEVPFPASDAELRSLVLLKTWRGLLDSCEKDWLVCIGALLQVVRQY